MRRAVDTFMRGLLATAQVLAVAACSGTVLVFSWCALIILQRALDRPPAQEPEPVPEHLSPDDLPPDTTVELSDGTVMTIAEWRAQFTERQWETFEALAAQYSALHARLD